MAHWKSAKANHAGKKRKRPNYAFLGSPKSGPTRPGRHECQIHQRTKQLRTQRDSSAIPASRLWFVYMGTGWAGSATNIISRRHSTHASTHKGMIGRTTFPPHPKEGPLPDKTPAGQNVAQWHSKPPAFDNAHPRYCADAVAAARTLASWRPAW